MSETTPKKVIPVDCFACSGRFIAIKYAIGGRKCTNEDVPVKLSLLLGNAKVVNDLLELKTENKIR